MLSTWKDIRENNWRTFHLSLIVKDLDKTLAYYQSLGLRVTDSIPYLVCIMVLRQNRCQMTLQSYGRNLASSDINASLFARACAINIRSIGLVME